MNFKTIINAFLSAFNYVDENGKRNGFLLFSNNLLTQDLEILAIDLKRKLNTLADNANLTDIMKCDEFNTLIKECFKSAQAARMSRAPLETCHEYYPPSWGSRVGMTLHYTYKNPYEPSKFEKELLNGLDAIQQQLNKSESINFAEHLQSTCNNLTNVIKHYEPKQVTINDWSYYP